MKKEPYITRRQGKSGISFKVRVRAEGNDIIKTFCVRDYQSEKTALETARQFRDKALYEIRVGLAVKKNNTTVEEIFEKFIESSVLSANTKRKHRIQFGKYIHHKSTKLQELTKADIQEDMNKMVEIASDDTISKVFSIWRNDIIAPAIMDEIIARDLTLGVKKPTSHVVHQKKSTLTDRGTVDKVEDLIRRKVMNNYNARIIVYFIEVLYYTGMRPAEAEALTKSDIKNGYIDINKELGSSIDDFNVIRRCKTEDSVRRIPIHPKLKPILEDLVEYAEDERLFLRSDGQYINSDWLGNIISRLCKREGIEFNLYRMRHNVATNLVTNNVDQKTTIELLGHANYDMSLYYATSNDELKESAINLVS